MVGETQPRAVGAVVASVCAGRWRTRTHYDGPRLRVAHVERIPPRNRETGGGCVVNCVIQVFGPIAGGFYHNHTPRTGIQNSRKIVGPPLDSNQTQLIFPIDEIEPGTGPVQFDQDNIARAQGIGGLPNRYRRTHTRPKNRDGTGVGIRANPRDANSVFVAPKHAYYRRTVVNPPHLRRLHTANNPTLVTEQVFVGKSPRTLNVDNPGSIAFPTRQCPGITSVDTTWCGV